MKPAYRMFLIALFAVQLSVPVLVITTQERILKDGKLVKFITKPVDPGDFFRGRYVRLGFESDEAPDDGTQHWSPREKAFALLETDAEGIVRRSVLSRRRPASGLYVPVNIRYAYDGKVFFNYPFLRYYMEESMAPKAEEVYRRLSASELKQAMASVRILNGRSALENVWIEGKPIIEYIKN